MNGVLLGAAISIILLLRQAARPRVVELTRVPGTTHFADAERHPENVRIPGVLVVRCESSLLYFNVEHARERVLELLAARPYVQCLVFFLGAVPNVDLAGVELLTDLHRICRGRGIVLRLASVYGEVRDALRRAAFEQVHGAVQTGQTIAVVIAEWQARAAADRSLEILPSSFLNSPEKEGESFVK